MDKKITAILVDDMELARKNLAAEIEEHCPQIELIGEADGVVSALKLLKNIQPQLLFLDIELEDGVGFDILDVLGEDAHAQVIFVTASNDYAIRAFQASALDYLLKPVEPALLIKAVEKLSTQKQSEEQFEILKSASGKNQEIQRIALHTQEKIVLAKVEDVIRCEASGNYTTIYLRDRGKVLVSKTMKEYVNILPSTLFIRPHQSHLVNINEIREYVKTEGGYLLLEDESMVPVSLRKRTEVMERLANS